jgi:tetratricopeptide (TPR) repeat protein
MKVIFVHLLLFAVVRGTTDDFSHGEQAYQNSDYELAEIYLSHLLVSDPFHTHTPDAVYYLIDIKKKKGDFPGMITLANRFLNDFKYDMRGKEILLMILEYLNSAQAYSIAFEYTRQYDYLIDGEDIFKMIGYGLYQQESYDCADYMFSLCTQTDSIKILRARMSSDPVKKLEFYGSIEGIKGLIYTAESYLDLGDTINAYLAYTKIKDVETDDRLFYRYIELSTLFNRDALPELVERLGRIPEFSRKARLIEARFGLQPPVYPVDQEEVELYIACLDQDTVMTGLPDSIDIDALLPDSMNEQSILYLYDTLGACYYLDSLYCDFLMHEDRINKAYHTIEPYLRYQNTNAFARKVRALKNYYNGNYGITANDLILANARQPSYRFILANALARQDFDALFIYEDILYKTSDSVLLGQVSKVLLEDYLSSGKFEDAARLDYSAFKNDTALIRLYVHSLARTGPKQKADSLLYQYGMAPDPMYINYYGEDLIERQKYKSAQVLYDSLVQLNEKDVPDIIRYNWALIPFIRGKTDTALSRFQDFFSMLEDEEVYARTSFKIATIKYHKHEFDSAAYYYELAGKYDDLHLNALENQMICYKKYGNWSMLIQTGEVLLPVCSDDDRADVFFDIGYGYLRSGYVREAVVYLSKAAKTEPSPEFYYWLAEAYIAKGEFARGLYQYRRIVDQFPNDEMWTPTAEYKSGIAFELLDELEQAKRIYRSIIKRRGEHDTWGIEAQNRLKELE